ncbi:hypothetical protein MPH_09316 [Macrophomina phaseolina MS6]|uniref:Uncharacterized protein n=1 Tax=Macrophomina phaseolina (strain MS6) TaxID=1126212 RepID=K2RL97_MACPH|nr:hypothetical protein MPH_09316 [Macrophomina phaseolina MS6]
MVSFSLPGAYGADVKVIATQLSLRVEHGVNVQARFLWLARQLSHALDQLLLEVIGHVALVAEENYSAAGYYGRHRCEFLLSLQKLFLRALTRDGKIPQQFVCVGCVQHVYQVCLRKLGANGRGDVELLQWLKNSSQLQRFWKSGFLSKSSAQTWRASRLQCGCTQCRRAAAKQDTCCS